ncbi:MAG: S41 family peptidase [Clostridiales bacterium]|nr:S41 family peptidase [Clostridiales bacterium]
MLTIKKRNLIFLLVFFLIVGAVAAGTFVYIVKDDNLTNRVVLTQEEYEVLTSAAEHGQALFEEYGHLAALKDYIHQHYYKDVEDEVLMEGSYRGVFAALGDPYSSYLNKQEYENMLISFRGEFEGVGLTLTEDEFGYINVVAPIDGSPAAEAGIRTNDKVIKVDGVEYTSQDLYGAVSAMRGEAGTKVEVTILRDGEELVFDLIRRTIVMESVTFEVTEDNLGYIRVSSIESNTAEYFTAAIDELEAADVDGLIIDLRDNPGGDVAASVEMADALLGGGVVTYTENNAGERNYYESKIGATDLPYVILVNGGTASACEIITSAVQDRDGGEIVGTKTFGKGIIQSIVPLENGDAVKMTTMQYFSPAGNVIHEIGITPDYVIELDDADYDESGNIINDKQMEKAIKLLKK